MRTRIFLLAALSLLAVACQPQADVVIHTTEGPIGIRLYHDTPKHRENFLKLAREGFYQGTGFHRVISGFVVQGGDPYSKDSTKWDSLGLGEPGYMLDAEVRSAHIHKRGALAAARQGDDINPFMRSSGSQFYIVTGVKISADSVVYYERLPNKQDYMYRTAIIDSLSNPRYDGLRDSIMRSQQIVDALVAKRTNADTLAAMDFSQKIQNAMTPIVTAIRNRPYKPFTYTAEQKQAYTQQGGTPMLDAGYTVFGEVVYGMDVVDKMVAAPRGPNDRPIKMVTVTKVDVNE